MRLNDFLRWGIVASVLAVFFIPLYVANPLFFPFITGKGFAFRIIVEIATLFWVILALRDPSVRPRRSWIFFALSAFVVVIGLADFFGVNAHKSFWSNFERMEGFIGLIHLYAFFVVLWSTFRTGKWWRMLFETGIFVSVIEGCYGVLQLSGKLAIHQGGVRVDGTFGNATYLAVYMLFSFFFTALAYYWWGQKGKYVRWWYAFAGVLQLLMIFYTATRGTILGLVGGLLLASLIFLVFGKSSPHLKKIGIGFFIGISLLGGVIFAFRDSAFVHNHEVLSRVASISLSEGSTRFTLWGMAWKGFLERPVLGWGQENFNYIFNANYQPSLYGQEPWFDRAHNEFVDWLVAGGALGFLLYLSLFALALFVLWRPQSNFSLIEKGLFTGLIAAYGFHNLFVFDNLLSYILFFTLLAYLAHRFEGEASVSPLSAHWWAKPAPDGLGAFLAPVAIGIMVALFYFSNVPGIATASNLIQALKPQPAGILSNVEFLKRAGETTGLGRQEVREQIVQFAAQVRQSKIGDANFQKKMDDYAILSMTDEVSKNPNDARLHMFLGSFYRQASMMDEAISEFSKAHALAPKKQQILFELGLSELTRQNVPVALEYFKQAYDLDHTFDAARALYAAALIRTGDPAGKALLIERFNTTTPDDDVLLQTYLDIGDYGSVIAIVKTRADNDPKNIKARVQLAAVYLQAGERTKAIEALQQAILIDPSFKEQGEYYIQEIASGRTP